MNALLNRTVRRIGRILPRTLALAVMTVAAFALMLPVYHLTGQPEVMQVLRAAALLMWIEHTVFVARVTVMPDIDAQVITNQASANVVQLTNTFTWIARIAVLLWLMQ